MTTEIKKLHSTFGVQPEIIVLGAEIVRLSSINTALLAALRDAIASLQVQSATYRIQGGVPNIELANELDRNCKSYSAAIAKAEGR